MTLQKIAITFEGSWPQFLKVVVADIEVVDLEAVPKAVGAKWSQTILTQIQPVGGEKFKGENSSTSKYSNT